MLHLVSVSSQPIRDYLTVALFRTLLGAHQAARLGIGQVHEPFDQQVASLVHEPPIPLGSIIHADEEVAQFLKPDIVDASTGQQVLDPLVRGPRLGVDPHAGVVGLPVPAPGCQSRGSTSQARPGLLHRLSQGDNRLPAGRGQTDKGLDVGDDGLDVLGGNAGQDSGKAGQDRGGRGEGGGTETHDKTRRLL